MSLFTASGTLGRGRFACAVICVYALGLTSQILLTGPVLLRVGLWPFILLHAALLWVWYAVHAKRLRDAGRDAGSAIGIAVVNALCLTFLVMLIALFYSPVDSPTTAGETVGGVIGTWIVFIFLIEFLSGGLNFDFISFVLIMVALMALLPVLLAVCFSIWAGTRKRAAAAP